MKVAPVSLPEYVEFISRIPMDSIFQFPQYHHIQELIRPGRVRFDPFRIEENDKTILVPLLVEERQKGYPEYIVPFNSVISDKPLVNDDYSLILDTLVNRRPFMVKFRASLQNPHPFSDALQKMKLKVSQKSTWVIDLPSSFEDWLVMLSGKTRYKLRKRLKSEESMGLYVREQGIEGLDDFLRLFYMRFHDQIEVLNTLPAVSFHQLFHRMPPQTVKIHELCHDQKVIASWLLIYGSPECFAHSSAFDKDSRDLYPGDLLNAHVIKGLIESGHKTFNLGGTGKSDTLSVFKEKSGARETFYDQAVWKNRWLALKRSFYFPISKSFSIKKYFLIKQDLIPPQSNPELPQAIEWFMINEERELEKLIEEGYFLKGKDEKGKTFMNESIARTRLSEKQMLNLAFHHKRLVYTRSLVFARSLPFAHIIPSIPLNDKEVFAWHANTPVFFRKLGYHKIFTRLVKCLMREQGMESMYLAVRKDNTPSLKAHLDTGGTIMKSFYVIRLNKKVWCLGRFKDK